MDTCPYCNKVLSFMRQNQISIPMKNTFDQKNKQELIALGGKSQVPCLVIDGQALYESDDIIQWFKNNWKK